MHERGDPSVAGGEGIRYRPTRGSRLVNGLVLAGLSALLAWTLVQTVRQGAWWAAGLLVVFLVFLAYGIGPQLTASVGVDSQGVRIGGLRGRRMIAWEEIGSVEYLTGPKGSEDVILHLRSGGHAVLDVLQTPAVFERDWRTIQRIRARIDDECRARGIPMVTE